MISRSKTDQAATGLPRIGVLGSGKGSNFHALLGAVQSGDLSADIAVVISDEPDAGILQIAAAAGISVETIPEPAFRTRLSPETEERLVATLRHHKVEVVVLAGFMRVLKQPMLDAFPGRIVNIHPSLLPAFPGLAAWKQALAAGVAETGCTVHLVDAGVDSGAILDQERVEVLHGDTAESLHARIQTAEHCLFPRALRNFLSTL